MKGAFIIRERKGGYSLNYRMPDGELLFKPSVYPDYDSVMEMAEYLATLDDMEQWCLQCSSCKTDFTVVFSNDDRRTLFEGKHKYTKRKAWDRVRAMCESFADAETIVLKKGQRLKPPKEKSAGSQ
ncbi:MAG: hypothetical protein WBG42_15125 [Cryomorphaceae bacterium]